MADDAIECRLEPRAGIADEDQSLVCAAQRDPAAAGRLYDKYYPQISGYIYHCTLDRSVTDDLTSNVFLAAFAHLNRYRWRQTPFRAWLYRIATNEVRMYYRRRKSIRVLLGRREHDTSAVSAPSACESMATAEDYRLLHKALLRLPLKYRTVIILRYFEDKTIADICDITTSREGTVKSQLHRGLARLQEILVGWGILPE